MRAAYLSLSMTLAIAACGSQQRKEDNVANETGGTVPIEVGNETVNVAQVHSTAGDEGNAEVKPVTAEEVVRQFGRLVERRRFASAFALWDAGSAAMTERQFDRQFDQYDTIHAIVGKIGPTEGAAGSLYTTVELTLSGNRKDGSAYAISGPVTLRRVNDVPGSTAEQRRWRIVKLDLAPED